MLHVVTYWWGEKYGADHVRKLHAGLRRHLEQEHRLVVVTTRQGTFPGVELVPLPEPDLPLTQVRGCFARLRLLDPAWQERHRILAGERIVCIDLDVVVTGPLDPLFLRPETFVILQGANAANPCPYNGSLWMLRAGRHAEVQSSFSLEAAARLPHHEFPDDQGWLAHMIPGAAGWQAGPRSGVYAFKKPGWPDADDLPQDARLVVFPGWRDPARFSSLPWVQRHWVCT
jgi:hypothetical protein